MIIAYRYGTSTTIANNDRLYKKWEKTEYEKIYRYGNKKDYRRSRWKQWYYFEQHKIINFPFETDFTVAKLINYEPKKAFVDPLMQGLLLTI